jgi:hypothetical protein
MPFIVKLDNRGCLWLKPRRVNFGTKAADAGRFAPWPSEIALIEGNLGGPFRKRNSEFHCHTKPLSRSSGRSAVAAIAYCSGRWCAMSAW